MRQLFETDHRWQPARRVIAAAHQEPKLRLVRGDRSGARDSTAAATLAPFAPPVPLEASAPPAPVEPQPIWQPSDATPREAVPVAVAGGAEAPTLASATAAPDGNGTRAIAHEAEIIAILARPTPNGELPSEAFRRKEQELGKLFAQLSAIDSLELDRRLTINAPADPIARLFTRLVPERRVRLIAFVRDARRREALARSRPK